MPPLKGCCEDQDMKETDTVLGVCLMCLAQYPEEGEGGKVLDLYLNLNTQQFS